MENSKLKLTVKDVLNLNSVRRSVEWRWATEQLHTTCGGLHETRYWYRRYFL